MKVINKKLLADFRAKARCEWCGKRGPVDACHIFGKAAGRVDIQENLIALDRFCHSLSHNANKGNGARPTRVDLLLIVSRRENTTPEAIEAKVMRLRADDRVKTWNVDERSEP